MATCTCPSDSGVELDSQSDYGQAEENIQINSAFYKEMLVLRTSFMVSGKPARIISASVSSESRSPMLHCSDTDLGMSVYIKISEVTKACKSILHKQGISYSHVYCDDQSLLFSCQYRPGLIQFLFPECRPK